MKSFCKLMGRLFHKLVSKGRGERIRLISNADFIYHRTLMTLPPIITTADNHVHNMLSCKKLKTALSTTERVVLNRYVKC
jgi:hypothetical protein